MNKRIIEAIKAAPYYRKGNAIKHILSEILTIVLLTVRCGGDKCSDMPLFAETHIEQLKDLLELPYGIPSHDTFEDIFAKLDPKALSKELLNNNLHILLVFLPHCRVRKSRTYLWVRPIFPSLHYDKNPAQPV